MDELKKLDELDAKKTGFVHLKADFEAKIKEHQKVEKYIKRVLVCCFAFHVLLALPILWPFEFLFA